MRSEAFGTKYLLMILKDIGLRSETYRIPRKTSDSKFLLPYHSKYWEKFSLRYRGTKVQVPNGTKSVPIRDQASIAICVGR